MMAGRPTKLSDLVREPAALEDARRRARAIAAKSRELAEERGIPTGFLAVGMATWAARLPDGRPAPRSPAAPVLLRSCTLRPDRRRPGRLPARPRRPSSSSTRCSSTTCAPSRASTLDEDALEALTTPDAMFDPYPVYAALAQAVRRRARLLGDAAAGRRHLLVRQAADGGRPRGAGRRARRPRRRRGARRRPRRAARRALRARPQPGRPRRPRARRARARRRQQPAGGHRGGALRLAPRRHGPARHRQVADHRQPDRHARRRRQAGALRRREARRHRRGRRPARPGRPGRPRARPARGRARPPPGGPRARRRPRPARPARGRRGDAGARPRHPTGGSGHRARRGTAHRRRPAHRARALPARARASRGVSRCTRCRRPSRRSRPCRCRPGPGCGCAARCSPALDRDEVTARGGRRHHGRVARPTGTPTAPTTPGSAPASAPPTRRPRRRERAERLAGGEVDDTARTLADVFRGIQLPDAPTANDWGHVLATGRRGPRHPRGLPPRGLRHPARRPRRRHRQLGLPALGRLRARLARPLAAAPAGPRPAAARGARRPTCTRRWPPRASSGWRGASSPAPAAGPRSPSSSTAPGPPTPASSPT